MCFNRTVAGGRNDENDYVWYKFGEMGTGRVVTAFAVDLLVHSANTFSDVLSDVARGKVTFPCSVFGENFPAFDFPDKRSETKQTIFQRKPLRFVQFVRGNFSRRRFFLVANRCKILFVNKSQSCPRLLTYTLESNSVDSTIIIGRGRRHYKRAAG